LTENKPSILIVEDDANIRKTINTILQQNGYETDTAENGREAIQKSKGKFFNLALLDIKLPDMEGTKLLISMHETQPKMMKIMVTGYPSVENAVDALNYGADAYVIKPFKPEKLLELIGEKLVEQSEAEKMTQEKVTEWIKMRVRKTKETARARSRGSSIHEQRSRKKTKPSLYI
jgi:DNA-binding NtrC family response regulator